jgi:hypothetical protein
VNKLDIEQLRQVVENLLVEQAELRQQLNRVKTDCAGLRQDLHELREPKATATPETFVPTGDIPPRSALSRVWCQIWHDKDITPAQRKNKTEWWLRLEVFVGSKKEVYDLTLFTPSNFIKHHERRAEHMTALTKELIDASFQDDTHKGQLCGMVRAKPPGKGRPWSSNQIAILYGHLSNNPQVILLVEDEAIIFDQFEELRGKGSKWFGKWSADAADVPS